MLAWSKHNKHVKKQDRQGFLQIDVAKISSRFLLGSYSKRPGLFGQKITQTLNVPITADSFKKLIGHRNVTGLI